MHTRFMVSSALATCVATSGAGAATLSVPAQFPTIQSAIQAAQRGDTVLVADGVHTGIGNRGLSFLGKAITVKSVNGPAKCIIDCQATPQHPSRGVNFVSGETASSVLDGFTITNGATASGAIADMFNGGAILCTGSSPTISNCVMTNNHAGCWGGAICCTDASPTIINCTISGNISDDDGGGIFAWLSSEPTIVNTVITGNSTTVTGGGIAFFGVSGATFTNCTIAHNDATFGNAAWFADATITNCVIWDNEGQGALGTAGITVQYSNIEGGHPGIGNINIAPLFVDPDNGDFHLAAGSPCLDAGDPAFSSALHPLDMDGHLRVMGTNVDMGADEVHSPDVDGSGAVNAADLSHLLAAWGACDDECPSPADLDANGLVDSADLAMLLGAWTL